MILSLVSVYTLSRSFVCVEGLSACIQCILYADPGKTWSPMSPGIDILPSLGVTLWHRANWTHDMGIGGERLIHQH